MDANKTEEIIITTIIERKIRTRNESMDNLKLLSIFIQLWVMSCGLCVMNSTLTTHNL